MISLTLLWATASCAQIVYVSQAVRLTEGGAGVDLQASSRPRGELRVGGRGLLCDHGEAHL